MIEYEIPFVCLIFTSLITIIFFGKKKVELEENYYYKNILIFTLFVNITNLVSHYLASIYATDIITDSFAAVFATINKLGSLFIIIITTNLLSYILYITFENYRKSFDKFRKINYIFYIVVGIVIFLLEFEVYKVGVVTSGRGSTVVLTFGLVFIDLIITFLVSLINLKKFDKRYYAIYVIIPLVFILGLFVMFHPEFNIYDLILCLLCYLMYFTIENPDLKMISQLEFARDHAERANRAKSDFLSSMSHEIRTPLNAIVGLSEDNLTYSDRLPQEVIENSNDIISASQTLLEIVGNILDINKIEANKMELVENNYNFREEITSMCKVTQTRIGEKNIVFHLSIADDVPYELIGDRGKVKEIINNLLTNAIKYTEQGEINLSIKCINDISKNTTVLIVSCQDTGRGIKAENITKLFTKFERLDVERNTTTEGTGLGLAITKALVEMMGGKINVQSQFGKGSIFFVNIPQKIAKLTKPMSEAELLDTASRLYSRDFASKISDEKNNPSVYADKKILIVDDNKLNIKVARRALQGFNFVIDECYDGLECLDRVQNGNEYDLILMDIMMPNMSGETAFAKLKENPNFRIPTIALTADAIAGSKEKYMSLGFIDYLAKPFSREQIREVLDKIFINKETKLSDEENIPKYDPTVDRFKDTEAYVYGVIGEDESRE